MHIRWPRLGAAFAVEKPGHLDGVPTLSVQFFDKDGQSAFKVFLTFGSKPPTPERRAQFDALRTQFRLSA
jgi:putative heme iron utilization protein